MSKISAYSAITSVKSDDLLVVVDVHDTTMAPTGTTKKMTLSQLAGSELFKFTSASVSGIVTGDLITGCSYEIAANTLVAGSSFRLALGFASTGGAGIVATLYQNTTSGTALNTIASPATGSSGSEEGFALFDFVCITAGASGVVVVNGLYIGVVGIASATVSLSLNTGVNQFIELFNEQGATETFTDVYMIANAT